MQQSSKDILRLLREIRHTIDDLLLRDYIKTQILDFDDSLIYVIYDDGQVTELNDKLLELSKTFGHVKKYLISKPVRI